MGRRRDAAQIARDRRRCADLYLQGRLQVDIARELGIDQSTVSRDLKVLQADWLASALVDFDEAKARELAKIDRLEREYWDAWIRSQEDAETVTTKGKGTKSEAESVEKTVQRKGQIGDSRFLDGVFKCIEKRAKIFGLDAATKIDLVDWRSEAQQRGLNPADVFEQYVRAAYTALSSGAGETAGGSVAGSKAATDGDS